MDKKSNPITELYNQVLKSVKKFEPELSHNACTQKTQNIWYGVKSKCKNDFTQMKVDIAIKLKEMEALYNERKQKRLKFFVKPAKKPVNVIQDKDENANFVKTVEPGVDSSSTEMKDSEEEEATTSKQVSSPRNTPAQDKVLVEITNMNKQIDAYKLILSSGINSDKKEETKKALNSLTVEREKAIKRQIYLQKEADRKRSYRAEKKKKVEDLIERRPEIAEELFCLKTKETIGRPVYAHNKELLKAIQEIAIHGSGADDRRRSEIIRSVRSLDDLKEEVTKMGFNLSRQALYLRLLPKRHNSSEGKRHVTTTAVKLCRASNDQRSQNPDRWFGAMCMEHAEELASLFGPLLTSFIGQDDKSHVPIGITAANKQAPLLMSVKYKVSLPDHDFIVATKHKLTPTVIGLRVIHDTPIADRKACKFYLFLMDMNLKYK